MDPGLPGMTGYEVARRIREGAAASRPWLVALTGYGSEQDRERVMAAGFRRHLVKPVRPELLDAVLEDVAGSRSPTGAT